MDELERARQDDRRERGEEMAKMTVGWVAVGTVTVAIILAIAAAIILL